ncbi:MAG: M48 family metalloprotease [Chloroflexota bacterium]|nr:M48 family metalloprotease [Chloroflexota bacterium]
MDTRTCPNCGHPNRAAAKFCSKCGQALTSPQVQPTIQVPEPAKPHPEPTPAICPHCGHHNLPTASLCLNCGQPISPPLQQDQVVAPEAPPQRRMLWITLGIVITLFCITIAAVFIIPRIWDAINPFDEVEEIISPITTAIGPIDLTSIPEQLETAIQIDITDMPIEIPTLIPLEIPTLAPAVVSGLGIELPHLSDDEEIEIGREAAAEFESENPISSDPALIERVERIGQALVPFSPRQNLPYTFKVVDTDDVNAFALPGGFIYVTRGMLEFVEGDHELAGVIGHELAHVALRHSAQLIENLAAAQAGIDLITSTSTELERIYQDNTTQLAVAALAEIVINGWGRENELDADEHGTIYMAQASYDPFEIIDLFTRMAAQEEHPSDPLALMFATHPPFPDRIARVRQTIAEHQLGFAPIFIM